MVQVLLEEERQESKNNRTRSRFKRLEAQYPDAFRAVKLAAGSAIGFLDTEIILTVGTYLLYGKSSAPPVAFSSPLFFILNIVAFVIGVSVAFFVSEDLIRRAEDRWTRPSLVQKLTNLGKFQLIFLAGNLAMIGTELFMLREFTIPPVLGVIAGAIISFPISYYCSMRFVWRFRSSKSIDIDSFSRTILQPKMSRPIGAIPSRLLTPYGNYNLDVHEYRFDVYPVDREKRKLEFALKVDVAPET